MDNRIENILSYLPSRIANDKELFTELKALTTDLGIKVSWGCKSCVVRAYMALKKYQENMSKEIETGNAYLLRVASYRFQKTGKVLTNQNSTESERKEVYDSSEGRKVLFEPNSIPQEKTIQKPVTKKAPVKKKPTTAKK